MKYYVAYGSNLNMEQMAVRCPDAKPYRAGYLKDYSLIYRGSKTGSYASIRKQKGMIVPVGVWTISSRDELNLDRYEGYPIFYQKQTLPVTFEDGRTVEGMVYIMHRGARAGRPSKRYISTLIQGYTDFDLNPDYLLESIVMNRIETEGDFKN